MKYWSILMKWLNYYLFYNTCSYWSMCLNFQLMINVDKKWCVRKFWKSLCLQYSSPFSPDTSHLIFVSFYLTRNLKLLTKITSYYNATNISIFSIISCNRCDSNVTRKSLLDGPNKGHKFFRWANWKMACSEFFIISKCGGRVVRWYLKFSEGAMDGPAHFFGWAWFTRSTSGYVPAV